MSGLTATGMKVNGDTVSGMGRVRTLSRMVTNLSASIFTGRLKAGASIIGPTVIRTLAFSKMARRTVVVSGERATLMKCAIRMKANSLMT